MKSSSPRWFAPETLLLWLLLAAVVGVGAGVLFTRGGGPAAPATGRAGRPLIRWLPDTGAATMPGVLADRLDPSVMSLPHPRGFSSKVWDRGAPAAPAPTDGAAPPAFLPGPTSAPAPSLLAPPALDRELQDAARKTVVPAEESPAEAVTPVEPVNRTVIQIASGLADRRVLEWPALVAAQSANALRPTRVQVAVAPDGRVRFANVERSSGDVAVDSRAGELARQVRFEPRAEAESLQWGVLRFLWAQTAPTNGARP